MVVTSSIIGKSESEISDPIHILSGEDIATEATQSLGETIDELLGVSVLIMVLRLASLLSEVCRVQG